MRPTALALVALAILAALGCGQETRPAKQPSRPDRTASNPAPPPSAAVTSLARQTEQLSRQVAKAARRLARHPTDRAAVRRLEQAERHARRLGRRAEEELGPSDPARTALAEANHATARAAHELRGFRAGARPSLESAREELGRARRSLGRLADQLGERLPGKLRRELNELGARSS